MLRGPQGTLYGASSMTGAIRVIFKKPTFDYEGEITAGVNTISGGGDGNSFTGMFNMPIVQDKLAARAVVYHSESGGYVDNPGLGRKDINAANSTGGHLIVRFKPIENLTIDGSVYIDRSDTYSSSWNPQAGDYISQAKVALPYKDDTRLYNLTANWDFGPVVLTASSSYFKRKFVQAADDTYYLQSRKTPAVCKSVFNGGVDCTPANLASFYSYVDGFGSAAIYYPSKTKDFTNEIRLTSTGEGPLQWTAGLFSQNRTNDVESEDVLADPTTGVIITPLVIPYHRSIKDELKQQAVFGEVSYDIIPDLTLTAGARYYHYDKDVHRPDRHRLAADRRRRQAADHGQLQ